MTQKRSDIERTQGASQQFLYVKTTQRQKSATPARQHTGLDSDLKEIYTDLQMGETFIQKSLSEIKPSANLIAIIFQIDEPASHIDGSEEVGHKMVTARKYLAETIHRFSQSEDGRWGILDDSIFACIFGDKDNESGTDISRRIKKQLANIQDNTFTIGMAEHPCLDYSREQIFENAYKALEHARFFGPDSIVTLDAVSLNISGDQLYDKSDYQGAIKEFCKGLQLDPSNVNLHNSLGVCYGVLERYDDALKAFESALVLAPQEVMVLYNIGLVYLIRNDRQAAMEFFQKADRIDGKIHELAFQIGRIYLEDGNYNDARVLLEKAVSLNPAAYSAQSTLGECYLALEEKNQAVSAFKKAIQLNGNDAAALSGLGWLYHNLAQNPEIAELFCRQSVAIAPETGLYRHRLGCLLKDVGRDEEAMKQLGRAVELGFDADRVGLWTIPDATTGRNSKTRKVLKDTAA